MVGYKLSNNDWVTPFFVIFRSVREILLVTVFLEHPVSFQKFLKIENAQNSFISKVKWDKFPIKDPEYPKSAARLE